MRIPYKKIIGQEMKLGRPHIGKKPSKTELKKLYIREAKSIREVAKLLGCSKDMVYRALKEYGIAIRSHIRNPKLDRFELDYIRETVKEKGYRRGAQELGVDKSTLYRYLKKRGK